MTERIGLCSLEAPASAEPSLRFLADRAGHVLPEVERGLGLHPAALYHMVLIPPGAAGDSDLVRLDRAAPPWAAGFMIPERRIGAIRIAAASRYPYGTLESVLAHEAAHLLVHDAAGDLVPRWFDEGVATWQGRRWTLEDAMIYSRSLLTSDLPPLAALDTSFTGSEWEAQRAYAAAFSFVAWTVRRHGADALGAVVRATRRRGFAGAWLATTGEPLARSESAWRRESLLRYRWVPIVMTSSTLWAAISLLALGAGIRKRAQARRARALWADEPDEIDDPGESEA